jgi:iron-sulfur cluster assembly accessory protein
VATSIAVSDSNCRVLTWVVGSRIFSKMINVTDNAVRQLHNLLSQQTENSRKGLRVQVAKGGCSGLHYEMTLDEKKDGDAVVERDGMQFFIDSDSISYLRGATLDFSDGLTGAGFRVVNPNASRTCGCGSSFETTESG